MLAGATSALAAAVALGAAAATGQAAAPQQVKAKLSCVPSSVAPGTSTGCTVTVTNIGGNNVNNVTVQVVASAGSFVAPLDAGCAASGTTLTCNFGKLTAVGTPGSSKTETHELQVPTTGSPITQTLSGRYSSEKGNNRGDAVIMVELPNPVSTTLDASADFDGRFSNSATDSVQTDPISTSAGNFYSTGATLGTTGFAVGLTVEEKPQGMNNPNCPATGCFGAQVIDFNITPLSTSGFPDSFTLTIKVYVGPGVQENEIDVRHTTLVNNVLTTSVVPLCPDTDPSGDCVRSKNVANNTKIATIIVDGPGSGNGSWGVG
jgi:hypothetical protein